MFFKHKYDVEENLSMYDDVLPIASEILGGLQLFKRQSPSKPLMSILMEQEKSLSKSPNIVEALEEARNAKKCKGASGITCYSL